MSFASESLKSPAVPAAVLLYGIVFFFAGVYFVGTPWQRGYTIALYGGISAWALIVVIDRFKQRCPAWNRIDFLFVLFFACILLSATINWWEGTTHYLKLMPALFLTPYAIGRTMNAADGFSLRQAMTLMGILLVALIGFEYLHVLKYRLPYSDSSVPNLFGQNHGNMLSGLLLAAAVVSLISVLLTPQAASILSFLTSGRGRFIGYVILLLFVVAMGWISSRGSILAGSVGAITVLLLAPQGARSRTFEILLVLALSIGLAVSHSMQSKWNTALYAQVVKPPIIFDLTTSNSMLSSSTRQWQGSILGNDACKSIVNSVSERWLHYQQAVAMFISKPVFGVGANNYGFYACQKPGSFPHSTLLQAFSELGTLVGIVYCLLIWVTLGTFLKMRRLVGSSGQGAVWSWFLAIAVMQVLIAQLNGNYFVSAALNFVFGVAASLRDCDMIATGGT